MHVGFLIGSWVEMNPELSSTLRIIRECCVRKHSVSILFPQNLTVRNNIVHGFAKKIKYTDKVSDNSVTFYKKVEFEEKLLPLHAFDCIMIRKDPPIDPIILNFLDSVKNETVVIGRAHV